MYSVKVDFRPVERVRNEETYYEIGWFPSVEYFDYRYPFRMAIEKVVEQFSSNFGEVNLLIEPYAELEDFIHFFITVDGFILKGYIEHSIPHLSFQNDSPQLLKSVRKLSNQIKFQSEGYQGEELDSFDAS